MCTAVEETNIEAILTVMHIIHHLEDIFEINIMTSSQLAC